MKSHTLRLLALLLAALCILPFAACGKEEKELPTETLAIRETVIDYIENNQKLLNAAADRLAAAEGLSFYYVYAEATPRVEQGVKEGDAFNRYPSDDEVLLSLAKAGFSGEVTHNAASRPGTVSFYTHYADGQGTGFYMVCCPDADAMDYLSNDFLPSAREVTVRPVTGDWYYVEVH